MSRTRQSKPARKSAGRAARNPLAAAIARLREAGHEGIYFGTFAGDATKTKKADPCLKLMFGYPAETASARVKPFDAARFVDPRARKAFLERLARDGAVTNYSLRLRRADQTLIWVEVTAYAEIEQGSVSRVEALVRDVSEQKKLESQQRDLHDQLLQNEKLAAIGQTTSGIAHELNNPLATILTWSERLAEQPADDVTRRGLETILAESERAAKIVRNLLTAARKRQPTRAMVDVNQVVRETISLHTDDRRVSNVGFEHKLATGLPQIFADSDQVKQVLLNLVSNAEQAILGGHGRGKLVIRTWHDSDKESVVLEVNDDGPGVPSEVQGRIFDPFFTTKPVGEGTGLGLTVAYAIMQEHDGRIALTSTLDQGATFRLEFPAMTGKTRQPAPAPAPAPNVQPEDIGGGAGVLLVEDESALAAAWAEKLIDVGFRVDRAGNGEEALGRVREHLYDVVICDLKMPRLDGKAFYLAAAEIAPSLGKRFIFVTGDVADTATKRFLEETGCRWLLKPFPLADLVRIAREVLP